MPRITLIDLYKKYYINAQTDTTNKEEIISQIKECTGETETVRLKTKDIINLV
jgi:hypothetical protein